MPIIDHLHALEILDSRGRPTVYAHCTLRSGAESNASVPSGASTGRWEAHELRDGDPSRYRGLGCREAVETVNSEILSAVRGKELDDQEALDRFLIDLDGSDDLSRLGANAILAVSIAFARAVANERGIPLYRHFADILGEELRQLPRPTVNLFSGGKHAGWQIPIQDVLVVPASAKTMDEALAVVYEVYQCAAELCLRKYGSRALSADEGGLAPPFHSAEQMLEDAMQSIQLAGYKPGVDLFLAVDVAASHFYQNGMYHIGEDGLSSADMIEYLAEWVERYPVISLEDGLAEDDWDYWPLLKKRVGSRCLSLGDDLLCTNPNRIRASIEKSACNALLLKVNQIGTLTEALNAHTLARAGGWRVTISARSGETEDHWLADLCVGWGGDQIDRKSVV